MGYYCTTWGPKTLFSFNACVSSLERTAVKLRFFGDISKSLKKKDFDIMKQFDIIKLDCTENGHRQQKINCPYCKKKKRFVRFFNFTSNQYLSEIYGRCDREMECGYFKTPFEDLKNETMAQQKKQPQQAKKFTPQKQKFNFVKPDIVKQTLKHYQENNFFLFLSNFIDHSLIAQVFAKYFVGTAKNKGTIFWQRNKTLQFCTGQKIIYKIDGHRDKNFHPIRLFKQDEGYTNCIFGEHLLWHAKGDELVCIVESEKTTIICDIYMPYINGRKCIWLASVGIHGITVEKMEKLKGFDLCLVPDFSYHARATWGLLPMKKKLVEREINGRKMTSHQLDENGEVDADYVSLKMSLKNQGNKVFFLDPFPQLNDGSDIADYFVKQPAPRHILEPEYDDLTLTQKKSFENRRKPNDFGFDSSSSFNIIECNENEVTVMGLNGQTREYVENLLLHPILNKLVKDFEIIKGTVGPL